MKKNLKIVFYGFLAWLIPFVVSFFFYSKEGLTINIHFFKTIMIIVGSISASILLVSYFKKVSAPYLKEGIIVGVIWFALNIVLDLLILIPIFSIIMTLTISIPSSTGLNYLAFKFGLDPNNVVGPIMTCIDDFFTVFSFYLTLIILGVP